ncbi:MAG: phosphoenolpyruvate--protein phosphotransferase [Bacteroidales bacterium]|nr:phosphoenolpyruvate--protein phosphotransferase [Bacteroidales bacterium]
MEGTLAIGKAWILHRKNETGQCSGRTLDEAFGHEASRLKEYIENGPAPEVFSAHLEILEDPLLHDTIQRNVAEGMTPAEAVKAAAKEISGMFNEVGDDYFKARIDDLRDVCEGIVEYLDETCGNPFENLPDDAVVVAQELFPSDTVKMDLGKVKAIVTRKGSTTSHVGIIARSRGIPFVPGADIDGITTGDLLLIDAGNSLVKINPTINEVEAFRNMMAKGNEVPETMIQSIRENGVKVLGNAGSIKDIEEAIRNGADGIGLFRTEFLFLDRDERPSEEDQYQIYKEAVEACQGRPLTIRTMDIGGDKPSPGLIIPKEDNPYLGMRGIRLSLSLPEIFKEQIRAILRASAHGKVRMMLPMVTRVEELIQAKELVEECDSSSDLEIGVMIETPAAALISDLLAEEADFFSIGTNDLTQYVMAADRGNASVSYLNDPLDEAVVRAVKIVVEAAHKKGIPVGVCGEAGSDPEVAKVLCELGVDSLSLGSPALIKELRPL